MDYIAASGSNAKNRLVLTLNRVVDNKPQYQDNFVTLANTRRFSGTWWFSNQGANWRIRHGHPASSAGAY